MAPAARNSETTWFPNYKIDKNVFWRGGCLISGRRSRKVWSLMSQPLQTADKPYQSVCPGHAQSRRDSLMRCAQWADVKKSWFFKKLHRQRSNLCRNSSKSSPGWLFLVFSIFYIFEELPTPQNSILWKSDDKISKNKQILSAPNHQLLLTPTTYHALQRTKRKRKSKRKTGHSYNLSGVFLRSERDCRYIWHRHETFNPYEGVSKFTSVFPNSSIVMLRTLRMAS